MTLVCFSGPLCTTIVARANHAAVCDVLDGPSRSWMRLAVSLAQAFDGDVGVQLCGLKR
jgi:hypothetical protein